MRKNNQLRKDYQSAHFYRSAINSLEDIIQRCHQRHKNPLPQRRTLITSTLYKGFLQYFRVRCAWKYPVDLYELKQANISCMPIGRGPVFDCGPQDFADHRLLSQQRLVHRKIIPHWARSWGLQIYTGAPSQYDGANWHDIELTYDAICAAPELVLTYIEALVDSVVNPLLTLTKDGGLRFSCRVLNYLHPSTDEAKAYIYKHMPTQEDPHHRDIYLEILGDNGHSRWDARYEILLGNLLDPPIVTKEVLFELIDTLRDALHQPAPLNEKESEPILQVPTNALVSLGSYNLDFAKQAFLKRKFTYIEEENNIHYWTQPRGKVVEKQALLWEQEGVVWVRALTHNTGLPMEAKPITDIWNDTGILPPVPATGLPLSEKILAVREGKLSPLGIKRPSPVLHKQKNGDKAYGTPEENAAQIQRVFNRDVRILGLITDPGVETSTAVETYVRNGGTISLNGEFSVTEKAAQHFQQLNLPSVAQRRERGYLWEEIKEIPAEVRMANPFQYGNVCEDPERCNTLAEKGGNPDESVCPGCPVYVECQQRGYLSQSTILRHADVQISDSIDMFFNPEKSRVVEALLEQGNDTERLCIIAGAKADQIFLRFTLPKNVLEEWRVNWQGAALGNFATALLNTLDTKTRLSGNAVAGIRVVMRAFDGQEDTIIRQMCQVNIPGKVIPRGIVDPETGEELARFSIAFEGGVSAYIPLDNNVIERLMAQKLPFFPLHDFAVDEDIRIPMSMVEAINLGILDTGTVESIRAFPTVCQDPNWTFWHQLKHFFDYYQRDADAPIFWIDEFLRGRIPPVLHPSVKRLLFISSKISEWNLRSAFQGEEIEVHHVEPTAWIPGNRVFQIRTSTYPRRTILNFETDWDNLGMSKTGQRLFLPIQAEIEREPSVKHAIITSSPILPHLQNIAAKENVCLVAGFKERKKYISL